MDRLPAGAQAQTNETPRDEWAPVLLNTTMVADWHREGGTNLSSARGGCVARVWPISHTRLARALALS